MDTNAKRDCEILFDLLRTRGIPAVVLDDSAEGIVEGTFEVRVPAHDAAKAERLLREHPLPDDFERVDPSSKLDIETVFHAEGSGPLAEMQAMGVKNLLESNGIAAILFGDSVLPNMPFEVKVARENAERASRLIAEAESSAAEAGESDSE
jgi:Putative prokaryotic signal transducing protein